MLELVPTAGEVTGIRSESTRRQGSGQCATAKPGELEVSSGETK